MKLLIFLAGILQLFTLVKSNDVCKESCNQYGEVVDCGSNCPPCRTKSTNNKFSYNCWSYLLNTRSCPNWEGIVDCGNNVSVQDITLTIFNNCGSEYKVYYNGKLVGAECLQGQYCATYSGKNPAFYVKKETDNIQLGFTLVELNLPFNRDVWYDISRVTGFNVGAKIDYTYSRPTNDTVIDVVGHSVICNNVNCNDAYFLCDIAEANKFNPVYKNPYGGAFAITFCPNSNNSEPLVASPIGNPRFQKNQSAGPFTCNVKITGTPPLYGTIIYGGAI